MEFLPGLWVQSAGGVGEAASTDAEWLCPLPAQFVGLYTAGVFEAQVD